MMDIMASNSSSSLVDRLGDLPDALLLHIMLLSKMTARDAVRASLISKRWRRLWASLPCLDFDFRQFKDEPEKFCKFVDTVFNRHKIYMLHTFQISCAELDNNQHSWTVKLRILFALCIPSIRVLRVDADMYVVMHQHVFQCEHLVELDLCLSRKEEGYKCIIADGSIKLPRLKKLRLKRGCFGSWNVNIENLILGCRVLEDLWMENLCNYKFKVKIFSKSLKYLTLAKYDLGSLELIKAPNLVNFHFSGEAGCIAPTFSAHMPSLVEATIILQQFHSAEVQDYFGRALRALLMVQKLHLCMTEQQGLDVNGSYPPSFHSLKILSFCGLFEKDSIFYLSSLWQYSPNLEKLTLWQSCPNSPFSDHKVNGNCDMYNLAENDDIKKLQVWGRELQKCKKLSIVEIKISTPCSVQVRQRVDSLLDCMKDLENVQIIQSYI